jgi:uncharacterized membrane protein
MVSDLCYFGECEMVVFARFCGSVFIPVAGVLCTLYHGRKISKLLSW